MKQKLKSSLTLFLASCSLLLTSCNINIIQVEDKTISFYSLINEGKGGKNISEYKKGDANCVIIKGKDYLPYLTLETYKNMLLPYVKSGFDYRVSDVGGSVMLMITSGSQYLFASEFSQKEKTITLQGSTGGSLTTDKDYTNTSLNLGIKLSGSALTPPKETKYSWEKTSYHVFIHNGLTYFSLSFLDTVIAPITGIHHYYSYKNIYQFLADEELTTVGFYYDGDNKEYYAFSEALEFVNSHINNMPEYLREDRLNTFLFIFENLYGLGRTRNIDSMVDYFKDKGLLDDFMSASDSERNKAFAGIFANLDDGHSNVADKFNNPWRTNTYPTYGPNLTNMVKVKENLSNLRKSFYSEVGQEENSVVYLDDKKEVAYFPFDGFKFANDIYNEDGSIKESMYEEDSFFHIVKNLQDIKENGETKKVIIDISQNGGGVLGVMMKILTLLSSNNSSKIFFKMDNYSYTEKEVINIDSNLDGKYDNEDVYGDDFSFYLLTSCYSFSCGNALPFLAQKENLSTIIGQNSGGGECAVAEAYLPSGEYFVHSSLMHIGFVENDYDKWIGAEEAAKADKLIDYNKYYDIPTLLEAIK